MLCVIGHCWSSASVSTNDLFAIPTAFAIGGSVVDLPSTARGLLATLLTQPAIAAHSSGVVIGLLATTLGVATDLDTDTTVAADFRSPQIGVTMATGGTGAGLAFLMDVALAANLND